MAGKVYLDVVVLGHPRAQARPRAFANGGVRTDSEAGARWKADVVAAILEQGWREVPRDAPLELEMHFAVPRSDRSLHGLHAVGTPDLDNLFKAPADVLMKPSGREVRDMLKAVRGGLTYLGVIVDDGCITDIRARKRWSPKPGGARIILRDAPEL